MIGGGGGEEGAQCAPPPPSVFLGLKVLGKSVG